MVGATMLAFPVLTLLLELAGLAGGFLAYVSILGQNTAGFRHTVLERVEFAPFIWGLVRSMVAGITVAIVAFSAGRQARRGSDAVGRATTSAVVAGLLSVIVVELVFGVLKEAF